MGGARALQRIDGATMPMIKLDYKLIIDSADGNGQVVNIDITIVGIWTRKE